VIGTPVKDKIFKTVILALLTLSILIQVLVSVWFYAKFKMIENRLSIFPVSAPVSVDLKGEIPELAEIHGKIDKLAQGLDKVLRARQESAVSKRNTDTGFLSEPVSKKARPRKSARSAQVEVVEKISN